jgi:hypothetical protein
LVKILLVEDDPKLAALALKDKHSFKADMDEAAKLAMFPHLGVKVA